MLGLGLSELALVQQLPEPAADLAQVLGVIRPVEGRELAGRHNENTIELGIIRLEYLLELHLLAY